MKHFTDRIFYLDRDGALAHIGFLTSGNWVLYLLPDLSPDGLVVWQVEGIYPTYEQAFRVISYRDPVTLLQEEWA